MAKDAQWITIGALSKRTGAAVSAIRFYEEKGLVSARRTNGGSRLFLRSEIRRVSFILIAQRLGFSLAEIGQHLSALPDGRTPTKADWAKISRRLKRDIELRIGALELMRDRLDGCIGCGCLSLKTCQIYNRGDSAHAAGAGPRYLLGDLPKSS